MSERAALTFYIFIFDWADMNKSAQASPILSLLVK